MRTNKPSIHAFYFAACVAALAVEGVLSYVAPWPLNFAIVTAFAAALLIYIFWPKRVDRCDCKEWVPEGYLCGKPTCPRTIAAEAAMKKIMEKFR